MVAGVPAAALVASAAVFPSYTAFAVPILLPYDFVLLTGSSSLAETLGGLASLIYLSTLVAIARSSNRQIVEGLVRRSEKKDLVEELSAANEELRAEVERRGEAESVMRRAKEAAEAGSLAKTRFLAKMSHEPVPIVALTAGAMEQVRLLALGAGMDDYLSKPITRAQLHGALSRWLGGTAPNGPRKKADGAP